MMYLKTLEILHWNIWTWSCSFLSVPGLTWKACLKKTNVKLELLADNDMLLMFEKGIRGGICQATYQYAKANNKYMKN